MNSSLSNTYSFSKPTIDEEEWVESIRKSIINDAEDGNTPVSIFSVPKILLATDPESYIPQQVAIGPFHHWRPEVYDMQRYKVTAARMVQKKMNMHFESIVEGMKMVEAEIRACYHKYLDINSDTLAWMMAIDMSFLLEFLQVYLMREEGRVLKKLKSGMSLVVDASGKKLSHTTILRDLVMVENQIPMFLITKMLEYQCKETEKTPEEMLKTMLMGLYHELSPFVEKEPPNVDLKDCDHLLDFLYHMTVPNNKELGIVEGDGAHEIDIEHGGGGQGEGEDSFAKPSHLRKFLDYMWKVLAKSNAGLVRFFKKIIFSRPLKLMLKLPWTVISKLPLFNLLKAPIENMLANFHGKEEEKTEDDESKPPLIEEITIPSVTEMAKAGIFLSPVNGKISDISYDKKTRTLYLPVVNLDVNTEVYLRNLVAYEACVASGPLVVARYTELMNGIIDTEEDARVLREKGIVLNHLKSDKEVADLWNGMSKSVKMTKVPKMDSVIEEVNGRYRKYWRVRLYKFGKKYVFGSWKVLTLLAALFLLFLTTVQAFCSVYSCARVFKDLPEFGGDESGE